MTFEELEKANDKMNEVFAEVVWLKLMVNAKWIPCKERLPEKDRFCRVLYCGSTGVIGECMYWNGFNRSPNDDGSYEFKDVVAWMPLPEPYRSDEDEQEES